MVVNHQGNRSRELYQQLKAKLSGALPVHQQEENQLDVWTLLQGRKDDFFIYDRCGQQTFHLALPYTNLKQAFVENGIKQTYCQTVCTNCSLTDQPSVCHIKSTEEPEETEEDGHQGHHHSHKHHSHKKAGRRPLLKNRTHSEPGDHDHQQQHHHHVQHSHDQGDS